MWRIEFSCEPSEFPIPHFASLFLPMSCWHTQRIQNYPQMTVSIPCPKFDCMINPFLGTHLENFRDTYWDEFIADKAVLELICDTDDGSEIRRSPVELGSLSHYL